ncbi:MAG TPA: phosphoribosylglycinamide formyltransferase [Candidatus Udaeobacter sp.]|nr:phosphoribosylglycinamide formyltransferase [Candidatus Udaeobacter sp.]
MLVSGRGSNLEAILGAIAAGRLAAETRVVVSDRADAPALTRARAAGVPVVILDPGSRPARLDARADQQLLEALRAHQVELVVLAGFMRILSTAVLEAVASPMINIHPSLLPAFPGLDAPRQALDYGAQVTGCTVHFVDPGAVDGGAIIAQRAVPVHAGDTRDQLADRILQEEHRLLVDVLGWFAARRVVRTGRRVHIRDQAGGSGSGMQAAGAAAGE